MYSNLNAEIARKGILQAELAERLHMSKSTLSLKLNGKSSFTFDEVVEIKKILDVDIPLEVLFEK